MGKRLFYNEWLGAELSKKTIFAEGLSLREAIALISSKYTKLIFGPSTGLLHCASGVYNILLQKKLVENAPIMVGYLGKDKTNNYQENFWWGGSYVNAILPIKGNFNNIEIKSIKDIDFQKLKSEGKILECKDYSSESILRYLESTYSKTRFGIARFPKIRSAFVY